jgi:hypothetical protein
MDELLCEYVYRHQYDEAKECLECYGANANAREGKKKGGALALWYAAGDDDQVWIATCLVEMFGSYFLSSISLCVGL